jgi:hypothetical protein
MERHADVPGSGGRIEIGPFLPLTETLIENVPFFSEMLTDFTALCSPVLSLYLKPSGLKNEVLVEDLARRDYRHAGGDGADRHMRGERELPSAVSSEHARTG